jgi:hypothetical protein
LISNPGQHSKEVNSLNSQGKWQTNPPYDRFELMPRDGMEEKTPVFEGFLVFTPLPPF